MRNKNEVDSQEGRLSRVETRRDRKALARDAGMGQLSLVSILAGTLSAYGAVAVLLAIAGGIAAGVNSGTDFNNVAWTQLKAGTGIIVALVLLLSYLFGGYVAGRMARRSGIINGVGVFVLGVIIALAVGVLAKQAGAGSSLTTALRNVGAPTTWHEWRDVGTVAGIAALVAMLLGSMLGGASGDRWHTKLVARALDPMVGPEAAEARESADRAALADEPAGDPSTTMAADERNVDLRDGRVAGDERDAERRDERVAAGEGAQGVAAHPSRSVANERGSEREAAADERGQGVGETRQPPVADDRALSAEERTPARGATASDPGSVEA